MRFTPAILEEIRSRLPMSDVVGRRVKLRRAGKELVGLSPFTGERTPSFYVNDQKRKWFDFSSDRNGDIFSFVMETTGCTFVEAVEVLARDAGVPLPDDERRPLTAREEEQRRSHAALMEEQRREDEARRSEQDRKERRSKQVTAGQIWRGAEPIKGTKAQAYLEGRGIDPKFFARDQCMRFHPNLWHELARSSFPALVAMVQAFDGQPVGVWRIYLGDGRKGRADIEWSAKLGRGDFQGRGSAVRLGGIAEEIGLGEGVETSAAARELSALAGDDLPVWPALSAGGIARFTVPAGVKRVRVFGDEDLTKRNRTTGEWRTPAGLSAVQELQRRYAGTDVEIIDETPKTNSGKVDYVDLLRKWKGLPDEE